MSGESRSSKPVIFVVMLLLVAAVSAAWWFFNRDDESNGKETGLSRDESLQIVEWKNTGIALLENGDYEEAAEAFESIQKKRPASPLAGRNLAIARILCFIRDAKDANSDPDKTRKKRDLAEEAIQAAIKTEPKAAAVYFLAGRLYGEIADQDFTNPDWRKRERASYQKAIELDQDFFAANYALAKSLDFDGPEAAIERKLELLQDAYRVRPRNLALIRELLNALVRSNSDKLADVFKEVEPIIRAVALRLKPPADTQLLELLDEAKADLTAKDEKKRQQARRSVGPIANLLNALHAKQIDLRELEPHELEYVIPDFDADFYDRADLPEPERPPGIDVTFQPAATPGLPDLANVRAVKLTDFDLDSRTDLIVAHGKRISVFGRDADDRWRLIAEHELPFEPHGLVVQDFDFDVPPPPKVDPAKAGKKKPKPAPKEEESGTCVTADVDLAVYGPGGLMLLRNDVDKDSGQRQLKPVKQPAALGQPTKVLRIAAVDFDHDSDLDLVISTEEGIRLWTNRGEMTFEDVTKFSELPKPDKKPTAVVPIDFNRDVLLDVVLSGPNFEPAGYLENIRHGRFRYREFEQDFAPMAKAATLSPIDADANVSWDWIAAGPNGITLTRTRTIANGRYRFLESKTIHEKPVRGATLLDYDNDGYRDVLAWTEAELLAFRGGPDGAFEPAQGLFPNPPQDVTAVSVEDLDADGDLDLVIVADGKLKLYQNEGGNANGWVRVALHGQEIVKNPEQKCNIHGVGSLMELKAGTIYQPRIVTDPVTHFGLGKRKAADTVRVLWTNGIPQNVLRPKSRLSICSQQNLQKGSCPYLYTWNGTQYEFMTDLLWASPIGLQFADGVLAPAREWEYLKIPGERLKPVNGEYRVQITEELWEAGYFDSVRLLAVDHPADVDIFTNEKVGPAAIAEHTIHTVRRPRVPVAARDQRGRNVLPWIAKRDGRYLRAYDYRFTQGLTPEHWLELDLGKLKDPKRIMLYLTGWVIPTDTSINVWLSHHPGLSAPRPPSLWVPDKNGEWKNVIPYTGFPGGKTKTIAIDLSKAFLTNDYRVQLRTSMELRWDAAFFTVDEEPAETRVQPMKLADARLFYRGYSKRIERRHNAPEMYDHTTVDTNPHWPPMEGRFTRYGDVTVLLRTDDDRLVVMGAGDAMTLRFRMPKNPPPPGWKRDFIIRNVGWDKDADLNTVLGQSSDPLPFRNMRGYPFEPDERRPDSREYREYLRTYQTRRQRAEHFWRLPARPEN